jgi:hypothetical protein
MMTISERQTGVAEKGEGEVRLAPDAREASVRRLTQRCEVGAWDGHTLCPRLPRRAMRVDDMRPPLRAPA